MQIVSGRHFQSAWLAAIVFLGSTVLAQDDRPNIVIILCDDLGYGDLSIHGHPVIQTKTIDELARTGLRFSNFYSAAPVCSPSRVGLLTGRSPNRAGIYDWIPEAKSATLDARDQVHLRSTEVTVPQVLKRAGYATCMAGKWHCNSLFNRPEQPQPNDAGFDHWLATQNNAGPSHENPRNFVRNGERLEVQQGFSCQITIDEVSSWLDSHMADSPDQPFFIYLPFHEPHEPVSSPPDLVARYLPHSLNEDQAQYFANVHHVDDAIGRLLNKLQDLRIRENTIIIFSSDNGPETLNRYKNGHRSWGRTGIFRGMKLHTYDGGLHVAGIINWPAKMKQGRVISDPASSLDLLPTICEITGTKVPENRPLDGMSLAPVLWNQPLPPRPKPLLWVYYNSLNDARVAMRHGAWKVLARLNDGTFPRFANLTAQQIPEAQSAKLTDLEIYNVESDPGETLNLAGRGLATEQELSDLIQREYDNLAADSFGW
ncbi:MAG: sulfatase-like hydrolase/transferase [Planctomycetota bacterium]